MSSCFGFRKSRPDDDRRPLLPQYRHDTTLQRELRQKLHSYHMIRALGKGYMPSTEQAIVSLRTLLSADLLNPTDQTLSDSGRRLVEHLKTLLRQLIDLLRHKNSDDQIQDFLWYLSKSRISIDTDDIAKRASKAKARAHTTAAYRSLQTVGSLLLTNSDFRLFLSDLNIVGREVFKDTAISLSAVAGEAGKRLEPSETDRQKLKEPGADEGPRPSTDDLAGDVAEASQVVVNGAAKVALQAKNSLVDELSGDVKGTLLHRLKQAVFKLRTRRDYSESVSTLSLLLKRYVSLYSRGVADALETARDDVDQNPETDRALKNFYTSIKTFGDMQHWQALEDKLLRVISHKDNDAEFEDLVNDTGNSLQALLTDPDFFDHADDKFHELREKSRKVGSESSLRHDIDELLDQVQKTTRSVLDDKDVAGVIKTVRRIFDILSPVGSYVAGELISDCIDVFVPLLIQAIQYIPIPRLEVSTPEIDILLENLIIEPGRTVNNSSFFPFRFRAETYNDVEIRKARFRTVSSVNSLLTLKIDGISMRAYEIGFWLRAHSGLLRLTDEGIASFQLDERGIDVHMDIEIGKERLEKVLTLKAVRVHIHKLSYTLRKSRFALLGWLLKPIIRHILRQAMEKQLAHAIADFFHAANRELLYARERLRATRIADPDDLLTFIKSVAARLAPEDDPDLYTRLGVEQPGRGVFKGVYAPGSIVRVWNEEAAHAAQRVEDYERDGWRNEVFDVQTTLMT